MITSINLEQDAESYESMVPDHPSDLGLIVEPDAWWPKQRLTIGAVVSCLTGEFDNVLLNAPAGSGKCIAPETRVLTADLRWVQAAKLNVGDRIVGIDEYTHLGRFRKWLPTEVLYAGRSKLPCYRIVLETGEKLICTDDHKWLCTSDILHDHPVWMTTEEIARSEGRIKGSRRRGPIQLWRFIRPWNAINEYDAGYLAGVFDGEGSVRKLMDKNRFQGIGFAQLDNSVLAHVRELLLKYNYHYTEREGSKGTRQVSIPSQDSIRLLGQARPIRLLEKWANLNWITSKNSEHVSIQSIDFLGDREVVTLTTEAHTFLAEGFGSHNTLVSAAVCKLLDTKATLLTHTLALQDQYLRTASWAITMKGKNNYPCGDPDQHGAQFVKEALNQVNLNAEQCDEYLDCANPWRNGCPYFQAIGDAADADIAVLNYAYAVRIIRQEYMKRGLCLPEDDLARLNPFKRQLLVCDEGHLANDAIVTACSLEFWHGVMRKVGVNKWPIGDDPKVWKTWAQNSPAEYTFDVGDIILKSRYKNFMERLRQLALINPQDWVVQQDHNVTLIRPIWARLMYGRLLGHFPFKLIMSATLGDPNLLSEKLGLQGNTAYIDVPSTFPVQNRPVFYWPIVSLSQASEEGDYATLASAIRYIANQESLRNRKGIIHVASYKLVRQLRDFLCDDPRFLFQDKVDSRDAMVKYFRDPSVRNAIIVTPSLTTGFDLPYEIGFQIIAKVPFAYLGDLLVKARREYTLPDDPKFGKRAYDDDALNQIVQASGRVVRAPDDTGVTYILDGNFWGLYKRAYSSDSFKEAVKWV